MHNSVIIEPILDIPAVNPADDLAAILLTALDQSNMRLTDGDILCVASKVVSIAENRFVKLDTITASIEANALHKKITRKDPRVLQLVLDEANHDLLNIRTSGEWIGARTKLGRLLTSGGIDKVDDNTVLLLPIDPDGSAKMISLALKEACGAQIGVLITDSDGQEGIAGATQLCIGTYGVPPIRRQNGTEETICDMLAAAAGLVMGQRGNGVPAVIIRGFGFEFAKNATLADAY